MSRAVSESLAQAGAANEEIGRGDGRRVLQNPASAQAQAQAPAPLERQVGSGGVDVLIGVDGPDLLSGLGGNDRLFGRDGDDRLFGGGGNDLLDGENGNDFLSGSGGNDRIFGGGGDDRAFGGGGKDLLKGDGGRDFLNGGGGKDRIFGGAGNDTMFGGGGKDVLKGGGGKDLLKGDGGKDKLSGGGGKDKLLGGGGADTLKGDGGADKLKGGGGGDVLRGGAGDDKLVGGGGNDVFLFTASDLRSASVDTIADFRSGEDRIELDGFSGVDSFDDLNLTTVAGGVQLSLGGSRIILSGARLSDLDGADFELATARGAFTGTAGADAISSGPGNDLIQGLGGNDTLGAGAGRDTLIGGAGSDIFVVRKVNGGLDPTVDTVRDFKYIEGDKVGLTEILSGISFNSLDEVARATPTAAGTIIAVKRGTVFQDVLLLENVQFTTQQLISYGFTAPQRNSTAFVDNPYGFANNSLATADPAATADGVYVAWVDQQNLDNDRNDVDPADQGAQENNASRDVFILNTTTGALERVSDRSTDFGTFEATSPALSDDGRFVAYVQGSRNSGGDVFVRDMAFPDSAPVLVSVSNNGFSNPGTPISTTNRGGLTGSRSNESASVLDISGDGKKVVFITRTDLSGAGETDNNNAPDVYLRDLGAGKTKLISEIGGVARGAANPYPNGEGQGDIVKISANGRYIAFASDGDFGVGGGGGTDIFLYDTVRDKFLLVSSPNGGGTTSFDMSDDGRRIVFATDEAAASEDTNGLSDVYVVNINLSNFTVASRDRVSEAEKRFEVFDGDSYAPIISPDGDRIAFLSNAEDLTFFDHRTAFDPGNGRSAEKLYVVDLDTKVLTTPSIPASTAVRDSTNTHAALTDDGLVYRHDVPAAPDGNRNISDTIGFASLVVPPKVDVPDQIGGSVADVKRFSSIRSEIEARDGAMKDVDTFQFKFSSSSTRPLSISVEGIDTGGGTLTNPMVTVVRSNGSLVAMDNNGGVDRNAFLAEVDTNDDLFIMVEGVGGATGSYRLQLSEDLTPPVGDSLL
ncbi:MAG: M10 family metallopeptidase C-terminal domain-containing protein [Paracoccaceae bacterium]